MKVSVIVFSLVLTSTLTLGGAHGSQRSSTDSREMKYTSLHRSVVSAINRLIAFPLRIAVKVFSNLLEIPYDIAGIAWKFYEPESELPFASRISARIFSGGLLAGVSSRILGIDLIGICLKTMRIEGTCARKVTCELGAYILNTNENVVQVIAPVFERLFGPTSKYWQPMQRGFRGEICHEAYRSCEREFLMKR